MKLWMTLAWGLLVLGGAGMAYIRFGPVDAPYWHQPIEAVQNYDMKNGSIRVVVAPPEAFIKVDAAARALPRTRVIAGSVAQGRITYETRTLFFGFPDYTTVEHIGNTLKFFARSRFGGSDFGVNRARLKRLLGAAKL